MINANKIAFTYDKKKEFIKDLTFNIEKGKITTILGPNGSGKSTVLSLLCGLNKISDGEIIINDKNINNMKYRDIAKEIATVHQQNTVPDDITVKELIAYGRMPHKKYFQKNVKEDEEIVQWAIERTGLAKLQHKEVMSMSGGERQRVFIAMALAQKSKILFLDEPTVGMDIQSRKMMWDMVRKIRNEFGATIFLTTHYLEEADNLSDTVCIMKGGKEIIQGSPSQLKHYLRQNNIEIKLVSDLDVKAVLEFSQKCQYVDNVEIEKNMLTVTAKEVEETFNKLTIYLIDNNIPFYGIAIVEPTLENVFLRLTKKEQSL